MVLIGYDIFLFREFVFVTVPLKLMAGEDLWSLQMFFVYIRIYMCLCMRAHVNISGSFGFVSFCSVSDLFAYVLLELIVREKLWFI